jgi:hypothetical protein
LSQLPPQENRQTPEGIENGRQSKIVVQSSQRVLNEGTTQLPELDQKRSPFPKIEVIRLSVVVGNDAERKE